MEQAPQGHRRMGKCGQALSKLASSLWSSGPWCMSIASVLFSVSALLVKLTAGRVGTFEIVAFRSTLSFAACAFGAHQAGISPLFGNRKNLGFLIGRGMCGAAAMTTYYLCIAALPLADAVTLFFLNPAVTAVAAWALLREPLGLPGMIGVGLSVVGLFILSQPPFLFHAGDVGWDHQRIMGTMFGVLSALCAAGAFICIRFIGKAEPALVMSVYFHTCSFITSALPLAVGVPAHATWPSGIDFTLLVGVAATSFWGQMLIGRGFQLLHAAKASAINFTQVIYSYGFGIVLLNETISLWGLLGSGLIAAGVLLVNIKQAPKQNTPPEAPKQAPAAADMTAIVVLGQKEGGEGNRHGEEGGGAEGAEQEARPLLAGQPPPSDAKSEAGGIGSQGIAAPAPTAATILGHGGTDQAGRRHTDPPETYTQAHSQHAQTRSSQLGGPRLDVARWRQRQREEEEEQERLLEMVAVGDGTGGQPGQQGVAYAAGTAQGTGHGTGTTEPQSDAVPLQPVLPIHRGIAGVDMQQAGVSAGGRGSSTPVVGRSSAPAVGTGAEPHASSQGDPLAPIRARLGAGGSSSRSMLSRHLPPQLHMVDEDSVAGPDREDGDGDGDDQASSPGMRTHHSNYVAVEPFLVSPSGRQDSDTERLLGDSSVVEGGQQQGGQGGQGQEGVQGVWHTLARMLGHMDSRLAHGALARSGSQRPDANNN